MAGGKLVDEVAIRQTLDAIPAPRSGKGLLAAGMVGGITVSGAKVMIALEVDPAMGPALDRLKDEVDTRTAASPGVEQTPVVMSGKRPTAQPQGGSAPTQNGHAHPQGQPPRQVAQT